jgi:hypothetical protein
LDFTSFTSTPAFIFTNAVPCTMFFFLVLFIETQGIAK